MNGIPPSPPIKKTPLVGVFFIGAEGEPLEVSASRKKGRLETPTGRLAPERSEEVQYLSISANKKDTARGRAKLAIKLQQPNKQPIRQNTTEEKSVVQILR